MNLLAALLQTWRKFSYVIISTVPVALEPKALDFPRIADKDLDVCVHIMNNAFEWDWGREEAGKEAISVILSRSGY